MRIDQSSSVRKITKWTHPEHNCGSHVVTIVWAIKPRILHVGVKQTLSRAVLLFRQDKNKDIYVLHEQANHFVPRKATPVRVLAWLSVCVKGGFTWYVHKTPPRPQEGPPPKKKMGLSFPGGLVHPQAQNSGRGALQKCSMIISVSGVVCAHCRRCRDECRPAQASWRGAFL